MLRGQGKSGPEVKFRLAACGARVLKWVRTFSANQVCTLKGHRQPKLDPPWSPSCGFVLPVIISLLSYASFSASAHAQAVESYPAPVLTPERTGVLPQVALEGSDDATPLGVDLRGIAIIDKRQAAAQSGTADAPIDLSRAGPLLQDAAFAARLEPFVGKPLSRKLIFDIRAEVTRYFRQINRPLVAVTIPPQEISTGVLRLEVLPFQVGKKRAEGNIWTPDDHLLKTVRSASGEEIASDELIEDINWLNLNPYRKLGVVFEPGAKPGTTDIIIRSDEQKPWSVYAGYRNSGSRKDDLDRLFAGFNIANIPFLDDQLSYQLTASPTVIESGDIFDLEGTKGFLSHSLSYFAPLTYPNGWRHKLQLEAGYIQSFNDLTSPFTQFNRTLQLYGEYAIPLNSRSSIIREFYGAIDFKQQQNDTFFANIPVSETTLDIVQFVAGVRGNFTTPLGWSKAGAGNKNQARRTRGQGSFDLRFVVSPGGLGSRNSDAAFAAASGDADASASYVYLYGSVNHVTPLPRKFSWDTEIAFQLSNEALPSLEQFSYGGYNSVRGYLTNEASGDNGIMLRNDLVFPGFELLGASGKVNDWLTPYAFVDVGHSTDRFAGTTSNLASIGLGLDYQLQSNLSATLTYSHILRDGTETEAGDSTIFGSVTSRF